MYVYQEVLRKRNAASFAASEALKEASAAESIIRSLRYEMVSSMKFPLYLFICIICHVKGEVLCF